MKFLFLICTCTSIFCAWRNDISESFRVNPSFSTKWKHSFPSSNFSFKTFVFHDLKGICMHFESLFYIGRLIRSILNTKKWADCSDEKFPWKITSKLNRFSMKSIRNVIFLYRQKRFLFSWIPLVKSNSAQFIIVLNVHTKQAQDGRRRLIWLLINIISKIDWEIVNIYGSWFQNWYCVTS